MKKLIFDRLKKDRKIIMFSLGAGFLIASLVSMNYSMKAQKNIANEVVRLHVLANSDEDFDQNLKLEVRDEILKKFGGDLAKCKTVEESREYLNGALKNIENFAESVIKERGYNYSATVSLAKSFFPTKYYGELSLPPGEYEALKIEIGEAKGRNWWCVMFPPLCILEIKQTPVSDKSNKTDDENKILENAPKKKTEKKISESPPEKEIIVPESSKEILKSVLSSDEYDLIVKEKSDLEIKVKFKVVEFWQNLKNKTRDFIVTKK
jgi:stage II sporulation protein R